MDENQRIEYIKNKLGEKGIGVETQNYIIKYVNMNKNLFGDFLDIGRVTDRIVNNLGYNISTYDIKSNPSKGLSKLFSSRGFWDAYKHKVEANPITKFMSRFSKKAKQHYDSTIMHEIDHCATTEYMDPSTYFGIPEEELEEIVKRDGLEKNFEQLQNSQEGKLAVSGISRRSLKSENDKNKPTSSNLSLLNEGITAYKQELYDKYNGINPKTKYKLPKLVAKHIADVIGQEQLIQMHFDNDYDSMKSVYAERTGQDLDTIIRQLNKKNLALSNIFGERFNKKFENRHIKPDKTLGNQQKDKDPLGVRIENWGIDSVEFTKQSQQVALASLNRTPENSIEEKMPGDSR